MLRSLTLLDDLAVFSVTIAISAMKDMSFGSEHYSQFRLVLTHYSPGTQMYP
jgi:hypothetical protein